MPQTKSKPEPLAPERARPLRWPASPDPVAPAQGSPASRVMDVAIAGGLLLVTAPLLAGAALLVRIVDGAPVYYRGERMGQGALPFTITKIRTLRTDAQAQLGAQLLKERHDLKTRTGNFLRETRIDELPQLWTVLKGDMALFGPRPERREVFEAHCADIPGYAERFRVRPGLFGYSQVLTPHGTPKRIRAMLDGRFAKQPPSIVFNMSLVLLTILALVKDVGRRVLRFFSRLVNERILRRHVERRRKPRVQPRGAAVVLADGSSRSVIDANEDAMRLDGAGEEISPGQVTEVCMRLDGSDRLRRARVVVDEVHRRGPDGRALVAYRAADERSEYLIDQYLLRRSIVNLPRSIRGLRARRLARSARRAGSRARVAA